MSAPDEKDLNDPLSHSQLQKLLQEPDTLEAGVVARTTYAKAVAAACTLPPGEHRICLLRALNSAVMAAQARARQYQELQVLHQELKAKSPAVAELHELASFVSSQFTTLRTKFSKGVDADRARGLDVWKTALPWYEHELCASESVVKYRLNVMRGVVAKLDAEGQQAASAASAPTA